MKQKIKNYKFVSFILLSLCLIFLSPDLKAQEPDRPQEIGLQQPGGGPPRPNLLRELNLSPEQIKQIQALNRERRPIMQASKRRLDEAHRELDRAIYADTPNETEIELRMKELHTAQMEVIRNMTTTELAVRRILTPEQLLRFRDLRGQFMRKNNPENGQRPPNRDNLRNLPKGLRPKGFGNRPPPSRPPQ